MENKILQNKPASGLKRSRSRMESSGPMAKAKRAAPMMARKAPLKSARKNVEDPNPSMASCANQIIEPHAQLNRTKRTRARNHRRRGRCLIPVEDKDDAATSSAGGEIIDDADGDEHQDEPPRTIVRFKYTRDELLALKCHPLSILRPECFDPNKNKKIAALSVVKEFGGGGGSSGNGSTGGPQERGRGNWEPGERWTQEKRGKPDSPPPTTQEETSSLVLGPEKRKIGDPRERIRKENDGIVLSPQRRSFNSGCFVTGLAAGCGMGVTTATNAPRRPDSPLGKPELIRESQPHREIPTRRIGSGRILTRDRDPERTSGSGWDFERGAGRVDKENDFQAFRGLRERERERDRDERYDPRERRSFGREYERNDKERRGGGRYNNDRRRERDEEPEWFSGGPTSQHDTIELHGFDDAGEEGGRKSKKAPAKSNKPAATAAPTKDTKKEGEKERPKSPPKASDAKKSPEKSAQAKDKSEQPSKSEETKSNETKVTNEVPPDDDFNLEDFLKLDQDFSDITNLLTPVFSKPEQPSADTSVGSRFSRWFKRDSPPAEKVNEDSRRSSIQDELLGSIIKELSEPSVSIPSVGSTEAYFAPISPAASSVASEMKAASGSLLEMLQRGQPQPPQMAEANKAPSIKDLASGRIHSVEELEAKMRQQNITNVPSHRHNQQQQQQRGDEQQAFQKLLMQVSSGLTDSNGAQQPQNFMQMLNKGVPNQPPPPAVRPNIISPGNTMEQGGMFPPSGNFTQQPPGPGSMNIPQDLVLKLLHLQQQQQIPQQQPQRQQHPQPDTLGKLLSGNMGGEPPRPQFGSNSLSPLPHEVQVMVNQVTPSRELLSRPEAQNIIKGLRRGELTLQHLVHQLHNTGMQPRHREVVACILKLQQQQQQQHQQQQHQQQLSAPPAISPRATSPHPDILRQLMVQQQQQQQMGMTSPLNGGMQHRVPSPRELIAHTQQIMQTALIKKKLEEQRENYRKRQEIQRSHSPSVSGGKPSSSSPLAFTPTSVLRKMTADKDFESGLGETKPMQQAPTNMMPPAGMPPAMANMGVGPSTPMQHSNWKPIEPCMPKPHQGRPIVKGGSFPGQPPQGPPSQSYYPGDMGRSIMGMQANNPPPPANMRVGMGNKMPNQMHHQGYMNQPPPSQPNMMMQQQQQQQQSVRGGSGGVMPDNSGNLNPLLQQLLLGQRSINSYTSSLAQQQQQAQHQHGPGRALRPQSIQQHQSGMGGDPSNLSQWFSGAGQMGSMPPIPTANTMSLEEIERRQQASAATPVHN